MRSGEVGWGRVRSGVVGWVRGSAALTWAPTLPMMAPARRKDDMAMTRPTAALVYLGERALHPLHALQYLGERRAGTRNTSRRFHVGSVTHRQRYTPSAAHISDSLIPA